MLKISLGRSPRVLALSKSLSFSIGSMCVPACVCARTRARVCTCMFFVAYERVCICVIAFWQAGRCCSGGGRSCRQAVCLSGQHHDNSCSLTLAYGCHCHLCAVTHLQPARSSLRSPFQGPAAAKSRLVRLKQWELSC